MWNLLLLGCSDVTRPPPSSARPTLPTEGTDPTGPTGGDTADPASTEDTIDPGGEDSGVGTTDTDPVETVPGEPLEVCINEFMPANQVVLRDDLGNRSDWIELHNPTAADLPLDGWSLTDDPSEPRKHVMTGGVVLPAGGYLVLWADDAPDRGPTHLRFGLSDHGEAVALYAPDGTGSVVWYGSVGTDLAVSRVSDCCFDAATGCFEIGFAGTPGATNSR